MGLGSPQSRGQCGPLRQVGALTTQIYTPVLFCPNIFLYVKQSLQFQTWETGHQNLSQASGESEACTEQTR